MFRSRGKWLARAFLATVAAVTVEAAGTGRANPVAISQNPAQARILATRAAEADAQAKLLARVQADRKLWPAGAAKAPDRLRLVEIVTQSYVESSGVATVVVRWSPDRAAPAAKSAAQAREGRKSR